MRRILLTLVLLAWAHRASAQEPQRLTAATTAFMAGMLADNASTVYFLKSRNKLGNLNLEEANPTINWMQRTPVAMVAVDTVVETATVLAVNRFIGRRHPTAVKVALFSLSIFRVGLAVRNVRNGWHERHSY